MYSYPALEKLTVLMGHMGTVNTIALDATDRRAAYVANMLLQDWPHQELEMDMGCVPLSTSMGKCSAQRLASFSFAALSRISDGVRGA